MIVSMIKHANIPKFSTGYLTFITLIAAMGGLLFGFDLGIITGVIPFIQKQFKIEGFSLGWVVAIFELGCMGGTFITAFIADKFGRKKSLIYIAFFFIITTVGVVFSQSTFDLSLWRFLQGVGVGAASVLSPMYIAEIAPASIRGRLVSINQLMIILGVLLATIVSYYFGDPTNTESWRWMFGAGLIPAILFIGLLFFIPESPRWLIRHNFNSKANEVLNKIGSSEFAQNETLQIQQSLNHKGQTVSDKKLSIQHILPVLMIGFGVAIIQQFSGSNMITAYLQIIFQKANFTIKDGLLNAVFIGIIFLVFTILAIILVDKIGRKKLLLFGTSVMAFFLFLLAWSFNSIDINGKLVFFFVMGFIATYSFTLAPVTWVLLSEMFPNNIRAKALSMSSAVLWLSCFVVVLFSPYLLKINPVMNFLLFGSFNIAGFLFIWKYVSETKGKSLEEIEFLLLNKMV